MFVRVKDTREKKLNILKKRKSRNKKKRGGLTGWELLLGTAALAGGAMKLNRMRKTRKNIKRERELQESLMIEEEERSRDERNKIMMNYMALKDKVNDETQPGKYEISLKDIDSITFERQFKINEACVEAAETGPSDASARVLIDCIEYMIDKILPLFGDEIDTIAWKKDRVTSGYTGDIIAILTHGGKFILFKTIQDEKGWDPVCATEEIYGTIRGATLGISSPVYLIARVKNSEEHYSTWHARPAPSIYAFVFKNLKDAYEVEEDTFMNACRGLLQRSKTYGRHLDAYCTPGREKPIPGRLLECTKNIMIDETTNEAYFCDMGSFVWN